MVPLQAAGYQTFLVHNEMTKQIATSPGRQKHLILNQVFLP
jgi:hypothetical protein